MTATRTESTFECPSNISGECRFMARDLPIAPGAGRSLLQSFAATQKKDLKNAGEQQNPDGDHRRTGRARQNGACWPDLLQENK
jgi:hypothetical protein